MAEATAKKLFNFSWEGTDKRGNRVKGKAMAATERLLVAAAGRLARSVGIGLELSRP